MSDPSLPPVRFSDHRRQFRARFVPAGVTNKALAAVQRSRDRRAMGAQQRTDRPSASVPGREYIGLMAVSSPDLRKRSWSYPFSVASQTQVSISSQCWSGAGSRRRHYLIGRRTGALNVYCPLRRVRGEQTRDSGGVIRMAGLEPGDFFGEMTLIEMQNR
jgi:hypothetical protein